MKLALCQINTIVGNFTYNIEKILNSVLKASEQGAELCVFPELALSSYPPLDLLDRDEFLEANQKALQTLQSKLAEIKNAPAFVVIGSITPNEKPTGRKLKNSALVLSKDKNFEVIFTQSKRLLPTYDVFDESRYFEAEEKSQLWNSPFGKIGLMICEDAWFDQKIKGRSIYAKDPADDLKGADFIINISASPFEINKDDNRRATVQRFVQRVNAPLVYVNQIGANDEILFDGCSFICDSKSEIIAELPSFLEKIEVMDIDFKHLKKTNLILSDKSPIELIHEALVTGIQDYFAKTSFKKAVIGLSGGIDSTVVATLAVEALGAKNVLGVAMPSQYSSSHSITDAEALAHALGIEFRIHPIKFVFSTLFMEIKSGFMNLPPDVTEENMQARLRAIILLALANKRNALVLTTGNKSELAVGYCTTYGDMAGAIAPLGDLYKTKVYELAHYLNEKQKRIPGSTLSKPPSAELRLNQKDEDSLGSYEVLDKLLQLHIEDGLDRDELVEKGIQKEYVDKILKLIQISEFKRRQAAPVLKLTSKAFGLGRRMPIAKHF